MAATTAELEAIQLVADGRALADEGPSWAGIDDARYATIMQRRPGSPWLAPTVIVENSAEGIEQVHFRETRGCPRKDLKPVFAVPAEIDLVQAQSAHR